MAPAGAAVPPTNPRTAASPGPRLRAAAAPDPTDPESQTHRLGQRPPLPRGLPGPQLVGGRRKKPVRTPGLGSEAATAPVLRETR